MNQLTTTDRTTQPAARHVEFVTPRADLHHHADTYTLEVEMPGVPKDAVDLTVDNGKLTIVGRRSAPADSDRVVYTERTTADYRRVFDLDPSIDAAAITASIDQGILTLTLAKAEAAKPRKISVG